MSDKDTNQTIDFPTAAIGVLELFFVNKDLEVVSSNPGVDEKYSLSNHYSFISEIKSQNFKSLYSGRETSTVIFNFFIVDFNKFNDLIDEKSFSGTYWGNVKVLQQWYDWVAVYFCRQFCVRRSIGPQQHLCYSSEINSNSYLII